MKRKYLVVVSIFILVLICLVFLYLTKGYFFRNYLSESCQPKTINYKSWDPYCVIFYEKQGIFNSVYEIGVYKKIDKGGYGHIVVFDTSGIKNINETKVNWREEGIELIFDSGDKFYIPKKAFIGGR